MPLGCCTGWPEHFSEHTREPGQFQNRRFRNSLSLLGPWVLHLYLAKEETNVWQR